LADGRLLAKLGVTSDEWIVHEGRVYTLDHGLVLEAGLDGTILRRSQVPVGMRWASQRHPLQMLLAADALEGSGPVAALDTRDLRVRWQLTHASVVALTPTIVFTHPNEYQCGSQNRPLAARAANSGRVLWHMPYCGWGTSLAADESLAVFHEARDTVTAREPQTGRAIWTVRY
jgi:hypothetical protein